MEVFVAMHEQRAMKCVVRQGGSKTTAIEVRRVHKQGGLKLLTGPVFEDFIFNDDTIKMVVSEPLSKNLYAFGKWVCPLSIHCNVVYYLLMKECILAFTDTACTVLG